jgi:hypothetical protein
MVDIPSTMTRGVRLVPTREHDRKRGRRMSGNPFSSTCGKSRDFKRNAY